MNWQSYLALALKEGASLTRDWDSSYPATTLYYREKNADLLEGRGKLGKEYGRVSQKVI